MMNLSSDAAGLDPADVALGIDEGEGDTFGSVDDDDVDGIGSNNGSVKGKNMARFRQFKERCVRAHCLADDVKMSPFNVILENPKTCWIVFGIANGLFVAFGWIVRAIVYAITWYGFIVCGTLLLYWGVLSVARALVFPGWVSSVVRETEQGIARELKRRVVSIALESCELFVKALKNDAAHPAAQKRAYAAMTSSRTHYLEPVLETLKHCAQSGVEVRGRDEIIACLDSHFKACDASVDAFLRGERPASADDLHESVRALRVCCERYLVAAPPPKNQGNLLRSAGRRSAGGVVAALAAHAAKAQAYYEAFKRAKIPYSGTFSLRYLRASLGAAYKGEQFWVNLSDGNSMDAMFLPGDGGDDDGDDGARKQGFAAATGKTMIICNPNACIYEFFAAQSSWIIFYVRLGINVVVYNYRGYGRSQGRPYPGALCSDAESLLAFLKAKPSLSGSAFGVHGESLGGVPATHIAALEGSGVSLLVCDRTFSSLPAAARHLMGSWAEKALRKLTTWECDNVENYLRAASRGVHCVCMADPKDGMVRFPASLLVGVARSVVSAALRAEETDEARPGDDASAMFKAGVRNRSGSWFRKRTFSHQFAHSLASLLQYFAKSPAEVSTEELRVAATMLWHADGFCGQSFGSAVKMHLLQGSKGADVDSPAHHANCGSFNSLQDWFACFLVWGIFSNGSSSELQSVRTIIEEVASSKQDALEERGIMSDVGVVAQGTAVSCSVFNTVREDVKSRAQTEIPYGRHIPLSCGHNASLSKTEESKLIRVLEEAGWVLGGGV